ncbi:hypothetical protein MP228_008501 [Amoeboaphelidium protococcarum]|nr:hypothetical protein MP228_008501 [Amoeboaphelidium protococcarum]
MDIEQRSRDGSPGSALDTNASVNEVPGPVLIDRYSYKAGADASSTPGTLKSWPILWYTSLPACYRILCVLAVCLLLFIIFTAYMLSDGVRQLAILGVNVMYPEQFDIHAFQLNALKIGPMQGQNVSLSVSSYVQIGLPVNVVVKDSLRVRVSYVIPFVNGTSAEKLVGISYMTQDEMKLYRRAGYNCTLDLDFVVHDFDTFTLMTDHILTHRDAYNRRRVVNVTSSSLGSALPLSDINNVLIDYDKPVILKIDVIVGLVQILVGGIRLLQINDLPVNKYVMVRNTTATFPNSARAEDMSVGWFFQQIAGLLAGDDNIMYYTSEYLSIGNLTMYDDDATYSRIPEFYNLIAPYENITANGSQSMDTRSTPFTIATTFHNPTSLHFEQLGNYFVQLNYTNVTVANVTVRDMNLQPHANTTVMIYGYIIKQPGYEHVVENLVPNAVLKALITGNYSDMPFSLSGMSFYHNEDLVFNNNVSIERNRTIINSTLALPDARHISQAYPPLMYGQPLMGAVQKMLARRSVDVGQKYLKLGPIVGNQLAIGRLFKDIPVFGSNGLGDVVQGLTVRLGFRLVIGLLPVGVFLANPFNCTIAVDDMDISVFLPPYLTNRPVGWVTGRNSSRQDESVIVMPPMLNVEEVRIPLLYSNQSDAKQLMRDAGLKFKMRYDTRAFMALRNVTRTIGFTRRSRNFRISLRFNKLNVKIGRMVVNFYNITEESIANVPIIPQRLIDKLGWVRAFSLMFTGWNMVGNGTNVFPQPEI